MERTVNPIRIITFSVEIISTSYSFSFIMTEKQKCYVIGFHYRFVKAIAADSGTEIFAYIYIYSRVS